jgi:(E)-4-hydroxy-3-methylbut-2-enyl-diphosphate synthase
MSSKLSVRVGCLTIGGGAPITIQSMTNTDTRDIASTLQQIRELAALGCDIVRFAVFDRECAAAVRTLADQSPVPLVADIHFDYQLAILSMENGISKLRINPGNIGDEQKIRTVADCAKANRVPIRIGVNAGSLEKDILTRDGGVTPKGMVDSALRHAGLLEKYGFSDIVISLKSSDIRTTVEACRLAAVNCGYPLHIGITEAGLPGTGTLLSAIGIGALLLDGIGDTIRVSLTGSPLAEPAAALDILKALDLRACARLISCPTCGRTQTDVAGIAKDIERALQPITVPIRVAVMGCIVNGPGEARDADVALCGGKDSMALYVKGKFIKKITADYTAEVMREVMRLTGGR